MPVRVSVSSMAGCPAMRVRPMTRHCPLATALASPAGLRSPVPALGLMNLPVCWDQAPAGVSPMLPNPQPRMTG